MLKCPECGTENPERAKFCKSCGARLTPSVEDKEPRAEEKEQFSGEKSKATEPDPSWPENENNDNKVLIGLFTFLIFIIIFCVAYWSVGNNNSEVENSSPVENNPNDNLAKWENICSFQKGDGELVIEEHEYFSVEREMHDEFFLDSTKFRMKYEVRFEKIGAYDDRPTLWPRLYLTEVMGMSTNEAFQIENNRPVYILLGYIHPSYSSVSTGGLAGRGPELPRYVDAWLYQHRGSRTDPSKTVEGNITVEMAFDNAALYMLVGESDVEYYEFTIQSRQK